MNIEANAEADYIGSDTGKFGFSYRGRFAPSPTGALHFGSLVTAAASYLDARANNGEWLVRMEDVDTARTVPGAAEDILRTLDGFGFEWDGPVVLQSQRTHLYEHALLRLCERDYAYRCGCSRKEWAEQGMRCSGTCGCRELSAWRVRTALETVCFNDRRQGRFCQNIQQEVGDFVVQRSDGLFSYQLAVVVDDTQQGITDVIRGADLLDSTPRQIWMQRLSGYKTLRYLHVPVVTNERGEKLSKQSLAIPVEASKAVRQLRVALRFLGQVEVEGATAKELWKSARERWKPECIPAALTSTAPPEFL